VTSCEIRLRQHCTHAASDVGSRGNQTPLLFPPSSLSPPRQGSKLMNTDWVYGLVVYAGRESKIQLNSRGAQSKFSQMERRVNRLVIALFVINMILVAIAAGFAVHFQVRPATRCRGGGEGRGRARVLMLSSEHVDGTAKLTICWPVVRRRTHRRVNRGVLLTSLVSAS